MDLQKVKQAAIARCDKAHLVSGDHPDALTKVEEWILELETAEERAIGQKVLLQSQDRLRLRFNGISKSHVWMACLPFSFEQNKAIGLQSASEFYDLLNSHFAGITNLVTAKIRIQRGLQPSNFRVLPHTLQRLSAIDRLWLSHYSCLSTDDEHKQYAMEGLAGKGKRFGLIFNLIDESASPDVIYNDPPVGLPAELTDAIVTKLLQALATWNESNPQLRITFASKAVRLSEALEEAEVFNFKPYTEGRLGREVASEGLRKLLDENPKGFDMVLGGTRTYAPVPTQAVAIALFEIEKGALLELAMLPLQPGTSLSTVLESALADAKEMGFTIHDVKVLPTRLFKGKVSPESLLVPCADGIYRNAQLAYFGRPGWRFRRLDWVEGWQFDGDFTSDQCMRQITGMPHPLGMEKVGANAALKAHYSDELLDELQLQLVKPGRGLVAAVAQLRLADPELHDIENQMEDAVAPPNGVYAAAHWRSANGALFVVKETLSRRLAETDIEDGFPMQYLRGPFPDCYFHFERPIERRRQNGIRFYLTGFYVTDESASEAGIQCDEGSRLVQLTFAFRYSDEAIRIGGLVMSFIVAADDSKDLSAELKERLEQLLEVAEAQGGDDDDLGEGVFTNDAVKLAAKIILYTNMRSARLVNVDEREKLLADIKITKKGNKREKLEAAYRNSFPHILIGPEETTEDHEVQDLEKRQVKVHWRRGFIGTVRFGEGKTQKRPHLFAPVLVNASKGGPGPDPERKTYVVK